MSFAIFDTYADRYDRWFEKNKVIAENELRLLRRFIRSKPVLEIGVGTGFFASKLGVDVGIDPSISMLSKARRRGLDVVQGFGERLPFRSRCFSTVLLVTTLCFLEEPETVLRESVRVLRSGGGIVVCIVPRDSSWGKHYAELGKRGHVFYSIARFYTVAEIDAMLGSLGLRRSRALGVLRFKPWEKPVPEEPVEWIEGLDLGFVCLEYSLDLGSTNNFGEYSYQQYESRYNE